MTGIKFSNVSLLIFRTLKKKNFIFGAILACLAGFVVAGGAGTSGTSALSSTGDTLTLDLQAYPKDTVAGGYWEGTYEEDSTFIQFGDFVFSHSSGWGGMYWDGFTYATNGDSARYGIPCYSHPCDTSHSSPWINHQWGVMAGGGIKTIAGNTVTQVEKGIPYLVGYWGFYEEAFGGHSLEVHLDDNSLFAPREIYISNHPWPYWGNIYGDGFARPLKQPGDYFKLWIHAVYDDNSKDSTSWLLAEYDPYEPDSVYQEAVWQRIPLTTLGSGIKSLYFTMETTDADPMYGPNTAVYFCMDKLKVIRQGASSSRSSAGKVKAASRTVAANTVQTKDYIDINAHTGGVATLYNGKGEEVFQTTVSTGSNHIDLSGVPAGEYLLRYGQKTIPVQKINE